MTIDQSNGARNLFHFGKHAEASGRNKFRIEQVFSITEENIALNATSDIYGIDLSPDSSGAVRWTSSKVKTRADSPTRDGQ